MLIYIVNIFIGMKNLSVGSVHGLTNPALHKTPYVY